MDTITSWRARRFGPSTQEHGKSFGDTIAAEADKELLDASPAKVRGGRRYEAVHDPPRRSALVLP